MLKIMLAQSTKAYFPQEWNVKACGTRDHEVREHIPHTWASSNDYLFQSNFSSWSNCEAILGKTPNWPI